MDYATRKQEIRRRLSERGRRQVQARNNKRIAAALEACEPVRTDADCGGFAVWGSLFGRTDGGMDIVHINAEPREDGRTRLYLRQEDGSRRYVSRAKVRRMFEAAML